MHRHSLNVKHVLITALCFGGAPAFLHNLTFHIIVISAGQVNAFCPMLHNAANLTPELLLW